jgi:hypothetical protein
MQHLVLVKHFVEAYLHWQALDVKKPKTVTVSVLTLANLANTTFSIG